MVLAFPRSPLRCRGGCGRGISADSRLVAGQAAAQEVAIAQGDVQAWKVRDTQ